jgi:hypothetical protein
MPRFDVAAIVLTGPPSGMLFCAPSDQTPNHGGKNCPKHGPINPISQTPAPSGRSLGCRAESTPSVRRPHQFGVMNL